MNFFVILCFAVFLMVCEHKIPACKAMKMQLSIIVYPIQAIITFPINSYTKISNYLEAQHSLIKRNQQLKEENLILLARLQRLDSLTEENNRLQELLKAGQGIKTDRLLIATIYRVDPDPFLRQYLLDKGTHHGVYLGQPVIDANGVIGSIIEVNALASRVMLLTDASNAIPVENVRNNLRAIAIGTGVADSLELRHVTNTTDILEGDKLVTSGLDGKYPAGYPVGVVKTVTQDKGKPFASIYVTPCAEIEKGRQVLLIKPKEQNYANK